MLPANNPSIIELINVGNTVKIDCIIVGIASTIPISNEIAALITNGKALAIAVTICGIALVNNVISELTTFGISLANANKSCGSISSIFPIIFGASVETVEIIVVANSSTVVTTCGKADKIPCAKLLTRDKPVSISCGAISITLLSALVSIPLNALPTFSPAPSTPLIKSVKAPPNSSTLGNNSVNKVAPIILNDAITGSAAAPTPAIA